MKIEKHQAFAPITITLETPDELSMMLALHGRLTSGGKLRQFDNMLYEELSLEVKRLGISKYEGITGGITESY